MKKLELKQITNVALLISISVGLVYFGILLFGLSAIPNLRAGFAGIPVKMSGFLYGPIVGATTGLIADILGLLIFPTYFHPGYTLNLMIAGFIPGLICMFFKKKNLSNKTLSIFTNFIIIFLSIGVLIGTYFFGQNIISDVNSSISSKTFNFALIMYGSQLAITLFLFNFGLFWIRTKKPRHLNTYILISIFVFVTDNIIMYLVPFWDMQTIGVPYFEGFILSLTYFGIKMWFNVILLFLVSTILNKQLKRQTSYRKE